MHDDVSRFIHRRGVINISCLNETTAFKAMVPCQNKIILKNLSVLF